MSAFDPFADIRQNGHSLQVWLPLTLIGMLAAAGQLQHQRTPPAHGFAIITDVTPNKARCNEASAETVRFSDVLRRGNAMVHKCVRVRGYVFGRAIFALKGRANVAHSRPANGWSEYRIGLYGLSAVSPAGNAAGPHDVIGEIGDCGNLGDENTMVLGYCHTHEGPFLVISKLRATN